MKQRWRRSRQNRNHPSPTPLYETGATSAIQKHSNKVWKVLAAVKTEFGKFGGILDKVSKKLQETQNVIDVEVGRRRRVHRKLQGVELLPEIEAVAVLELDGPDELAEEPELYAAE